MKQITFLFLILFFCTKATAQQTGFSSIPDKQDAMGMSGFEEVDSTNILPQDVQQAIENVSQEQFRESEPSTCGGSSSSSNSVSNSKKHSLNLVFIGNSITFGANHAHPELTAPPAIAAQILAKQGNIDDVDFVNMGKSGKTTFNFIPLKTDNKSYFNELMNKTEELVNAHPDRQLIFSIMLGTNDCAERPGNSSTSPYKYVENMELIIDTLLTTYPKAKIVLNRVIWFSVPFVTKGGSEQSEQTRKLGQEYVKKYAEICKHYETKYPGQVVIGDKEAYKYFEKNFATTMFHEEGRNSDFYLHPTEQGAKVLGEYWAQAILRAL